MSERLPPRALSRLLADAAPMLDEAALVQRLGKYRIVREVGRGGMGVVYEAIDDELSRRVALKVLAMAPGARADVRERFLREARAAARLSHPNIAAIYDASSEAIAMQFVDGVPLTQVARDDIRRLVTLVRDAALAVQHAHEQGVVHRDLKPQNLLLEGDRVLVTDFGLAKDATADANLSLSGSVLGTPAYMAPEQAQGRVHEIDARTDVYGLGATLYDLLAGQPPFVDTSVVRVLRRIVEEEPRPIRALRPDVPDDLDRVVRKCLGKEARRRYASARDLADDLGRWLAGRAVLAQPPSLRYRAAKFVRRRKAAVALAAVAGTATLLTAASWLQGRAQRAASSAALALSQEVANVVSDAEAYRRLGAVEQMHARLDAGIASCRAFLSRHDVARGHFLLSKLLRERAPQAAPAELDRAIELDPSLVEARVERGLALANLHAVAEGRGDGQQARALRARALLDLAVIEHDAADLRAVEAELARADLARLRGDRAAARRGYQEVLRLEPLHAAAKIGLSRIALAEGDADAAWAMAMSAIDVARGFGPAYVATAAQTASGQAAGTATPATPIQIAHIDGWLVDCAPLLAADPSDALAHANRGVVLARDAARASERGDGSRALDLLLGAVEACDNALELDARWAGAHNNAAVFAWTRASLLERAGRASDAARERGEAARRLGLALEYEPALEAALRNRAAWQRGN